MRGPTSEHSPDPAAILSWLRGRGPDEVKNGHSSWTHQCEASDGYIIVDSGAVTGEAATIGLTVGPEGQTVGLTRDEATEVVRMIFAAVDDAAGGHRA